MDDQPTSWVWDTEWRESSPEFIEDQATGTRLLQLSDLHLGQEGRGYEERLERFCELIETLEPECVVVTGDVSHVPEDTTAWAFATACLHSTGVPFFAIPGNHDVRAPHPFDSEFDSHFGETPRIEAVGEVDLILLDSFRWLAERDRSEPDRARGADGHFAHGAVTAAQLDEVSAMLAARSGAQRRVVAVHHHLHEHRAEIGRPSPSAEDVEQMRPLYDAAQLLEWCHDHDVRVVLTGHQHAWCPPETIGGLPNVRGTKSLAPHGAARLVTVGPNLAVRDIRLPN